MVATLAPPGRGPAAWSSAGPAPLLTVVGGDVAVVRDPDTDGGALDEDEGREGGGGHDELPTDAMAEQEATWSCSGDAVFEARRSSAGLDTGGGEGTSALAGAGSDIVATR